MSLKLKINDQHIEAKEGQMLLDVLNDNGFKVPTLCHIKDAFPSGSCRMCVVEDENSGKLITACSHTVDASMDIKTNSSRVIESRKTIIELLLSNHPDDCLYCVRNKNCDLQNFSEEYSINDRRIRGKKNKMGKDLSSSSIVRDQEKCVLCGRCVYVCDQVMGVACIDFVNRGNKTIVGTSFGQGLNLSSCINCGQCINVCPTGALTEQNHFAEITEALNDKSKKVVVQYAPSISVSIAEDLGLETGKDINGILNAALRKVGFDAIFDSSFTADLTIMEESAELIHRIQNGGTLPMITSCCPGWVKYAEEYTPELIPNLSSCKSPQQMMGAMIKSYWAEQKDIKSEEIYSVSIMPCTAKKFEAQREEMTQKGISDVDAVLTTREFLKFLKLYGIDINKLEPEEADNPLGTRSSAGKLFGASGGVMEAALRTAHFKITGEEMSNYELNDLRGMNAVKESKVKIGDLEVGVAVVNGMANASKLLEEIKNGRDDIHFIEVMACPGGCIGGGGQPIPASVENIVARMKSIHKIDADSDLRTSHSNKQIIELYDKFLGEPNSHKAHELLHTTYGKREIFLK